MGHIPIGVAGRITSGDGQGRYVMVEDDRERSGGYFIFTAADPLIQSELFDDWVEDLPTLARHFAASRWIVEWLGE